MEPKESKLGTLLGASQKGNQQTGTFK